MKVPINTVVSLALWCGTQAHSDPQRFGNSERKATLQSSAKVRSIPPKQSFPPRSNSSLFSARKFSYPAVLGGTQRPSAEGEQSFETPLKLGVHFCRSCCAHSYIPKAKTTKWKAGSLSPLLWGNTHNPGIFFRVLLKLRDVPITLPSPEEKESEHKERRLKRKTAPFSEVPEGLSLP